MHLQHCYIHVDLIASHDGSSSPRPIVIIDSPICSPIKITTRAIKYRLVRTVCSIAQLTSTAVELVGETGSSKRHLGIDSIASQSPDCESLACETTELKLM